MAAEILERLRAHAPSMGIDLPFSANTPYANTIPARLEPLSQEPGTGSPDQSLIRWNALAMVVRANRVEQQHRRQHFDVCVRGDTVRSWFQSFFPWRSENSKATRSFPGARVAGIYARAYLLDRPHQRAEAGGISVAN